VCAACGVPTHVPVLDPEPGDPQPEAAVGLAKAQPAKFAALRNPTCRIYLGGGALAMMATEQIRLSVRAALWSTVLYGASTVFFAVSHAYLVAAPLLVIGGIANLATLSITQTVAQLRAPREQKGQVIGVYSTSANGFADRQRVHRRPVRRGGGTTPGARPVLGHAVRLRARARRLPGGHW
jgi:hypothetical protein